MAIKGTEKQKGTGGYTKYVGMFNANVVAVNPTKEQLEKILGGIELKNDLEYTGANETTGAKKVTVSVWLADTKGKGIFNVRFNLEDSVVESKTGKIQYINEIGNTSYGETRESLPDFFTKRSFRPAKRGEETLYKFMRAWLSHFDYEDTDTELSLDWKKLISGNTKELSTIVDSFKDKAVCALATVRLGSDGKDYQSIYAYEFLPSYCMQCFDGVIRNYKMVDKFIAKVNDPEYGCKDYFELTPLKEYDATKNVMANSNAPVITMTEAELQEANIDDDLPF